ncbi:Receptor-type guanylate cyclase gcy [Seminavis robusta]|uniref:Receptor-type guanylate cyclase gcy n=1 Tax=Seminavis robusta TaxID=568900 RepID=A0A9N8H6H8_9STRA|nr:Receptor-type guanylate cyclase gcy [Seminavis robusta]|eukprot:Sro100_g051350.1 Receptor-type guanylate cyclase gcy (1187) ;mRNA; f:85771-90365
MSNSKRTDESLESYSDDSLSGGAAEFVDDAKSEMSQCSGDESGDEGKKKSWLFGWTWNGDSMKVFFWMVVTLGMIGVTAAVVLSITMSFLSKEEENEFHNAFQQQANVIAEATSFHAKTVVGSLESMSDTITSYSGSSASSRWPFVTVPDFDRRGQRARVDAFIEMIAFSPLVTYEDRDRWSIFTAYDSDWIGANVTVPQDIYRLHEDSGLPVQEDNILMIPIWQTSPKPHNSSLINFNLLSNSLYYFLFNAMTESKHTALSAVYRHQYMYNRLFAPGQHDKSHKTIHEAHSYDTSATLDSSSSDSSADDVMIDSLSAADFPHSVLMAPVYDSFNTSNQSLAGVIHGILPWDKYLTELLPPGERGIHCILKNSCGQAFSFQINGPQANFLGEGDLHNPKYDNLVQEVDFGSTFLGKETRTYRQCFYTLAVYPTEEFEAKFHSEDKQKFMAILAAVFSALAIFFFIFVWFVQRRQQKVMSVAVRTNSILSNLFPDNVRDRIMQQAEAQANREMDGDSMTGHDSNSNLKSLLQEPAFVPGMVIRKSVRGSISGSMRGNPVPGITILQDSPIADLYPDCTVLFADIVGFTAWSSTRDPSQVFVLLETLYGAFDAIAKRRRVFKVETIGDCYVAVAGLPMARRDHALAMARFANDLMFKSNEVFHLLEVTLGPGTSSLNMRLGLHSGPVTAGVLRGEKGRFQLFGDTVNTAARMESTARPGKVQASQATADLLLEAGKSNWVRQRSDKVHAKGKGEMTTFWVHVRASEGESQSFHSGDSSEKPSDDPFASTRNTTCGSLPKAALNSCKRELSVKHGRLVDWNVELLASLLQTVVAARQTRRKSKRGGFSEPKLEIRQSQMPFDEWAQAIDLPGKTQRTSRRGDYKDVELPEEVICQLRTFVTTIACLHGDNSFHNFDHASHVTMSVHKLLLRVIQSGEDSYRIASDPLTHFAAVMSALWHDVDHRGVPNSQLEKEEPALASKYDHKSVAEQHAIVLAWDLLMEDEYADLRNTIYTTQTELKRFRTVLVNSILSTDIMSKDLKKLRNERWNLAFSEDDKSELSPEDVDMYRASSVLEHLIQASDVSHTMQHWHVYRAWNERLFKEMYQAYQEGRSEKDPSESWYEGELGFFDFYIIPLAKKLNDCGVFGVSSTEYLDFALKNRAEWEVKGREVVSSMLDKVRGSVDKGAEC